MHLYTEVFDLVQSRGKIRKVERLSDLLKEFDHVSWVCPHTFKDRDVHLSNLDSASFTAFDDLGVDKIGKVAKKLSYYGYDFEVIEKAGPSSPTCLVLFNFRKKARSRSELERYVERIVSDCRGLKDHWVGICGIFEVSAMLKTWTPR